MANDPDKVNLAKRFMNEATELEDLSIRMAQSMGMWDARSHASGGSDPIIDEDIAALPITATILQGIVYTFEHFLKLMDNQVPTQADHRLNIEKGRNIEGEYTITLP